MERGEASSTSRFDSPHVSLTQKAGESFECERSAGPPVAVRGRDALTILTNMAGNWLIQRDCARAPFTPLFPGGSGGVEWIHACHRAKWIAERQIPRGGRPTSGMKVTALFASLRLVLSSSSEEDLTFEVKKERKKQTSLLLLSDGEKGEDSCISPVCCYPRVHVSLPGPSPWSATFWLWILWFSFLIRLRRVAPRPAG